MKTKDLIKELQKKNQNADVFVNWEEIEYIFERTSENKDESFIDITWYSVAEPLIYWNK